LSCKIGIPRGLLYYYYGDVWRDYFRRLGAQPVVSPETNSAVVEAGGRIDEVCLPVKVFFGHVRLLLASQVDRLFLPRVVSAAAGRYSCPKLIGLLDIVRAHVSGGPPLIAPTVDSRSGWRGLYRAAADTGAALGHSPLASLIAWRQAWRGRRPPPAGARPPPGARG
jgi:predicted nucleotide-binding protein (sugar kinase/HSP70/actin superfamily)